MSDHLAMTEAINAALAALHEAAAPYPAARLIAALYQDLMPGLPVPDPLRDAALVCVQKIAAAMPLRQDEFLNNLYKPAGASLDKIIITRAALTLATGNTLWLHYNAAMQLHSLIETGLIEARTPCVMHCALALEQAPVENPAPYLHYLMARLVLPFAPRDAIKSAILAIRGGHLAGMDVVRAAGKTLGLIAPGDWLPMRISSLQKIEALCQLPNSTNFRITDTARAAAIERRTVTEAGESAPPVPAGDSFYYMFRAAGTAVSVPAVSVFALTAGMISVDLTQLGHTQFYVFDQDGACVEDLSWGTQPFIEDVIEDVDGDLGIIGDLFAGAMNVCHFLLDHLTRIAVYDRFAPGAKILLAESPATYRNIIEYAGLSPRMHAAGSKRFSIRAERLLVSSNIVDDFRHPCHYGAPWALDFLRARFNIETKRRAPSRRIFISRLDSSSRNILNWPAVAPVLAAYRFEVVNLSVLTLAEQIKTFAQAECVVAVHGAGLTNVVFAPPGLKVLEILPQMVASPAYWWLCHAAGHRYVAMVASDPEIAPPDHTTWTHQPQYNDRNVIVDPARLTGLLAEMLPDPAASIRLAAIEF